MRHSKLKYVKSYGKNPTRIKEKIARRKGRIKKKKKNKRLVKRKFNDEWQNYFISYGYLKPFI